MRDADARLGSGGTGMRWMQLAFGIVCMAGVANLQYGWTLFVGPLDAAHHWGKPAIQVAFTIFILTETWLIPGLGYLADRFGPRASLVIGGIFCAISWVLNAYAATLAVLYTSAVIGGIGVGMVVSCCFGNAMRWFPDRRGLAMGLTASGVGFGSALTVAPLAAMIKSAGYESAFIYFGIGQGLLVVVLGMLMFAPAGGSFRAADAHSHIPVTAARDYRPVEILKQPVFWVLYLMFVLVAAGGLMATAQLATIAKDFGIADVPVDLLGFTLPALVFALTLDRTINGISRPLFGGVSDYIGRENTMMLAFSIEAVGIVVLYWFGQNPVAFVVLTGIVFLAWGEIYSLFPTVCTDTFGTRFAATNASTLYTAKGAAALLVPLSSLLTAWTGGWHAAFMTAAIMNAVAAALAVFVLKPMRARMTKAAAAAPARDIPLGAPARDAG
jgi:OFA family oxalate/formate antiporter-like MFS transporter